MTRRGKRNNGDGGFGRQRNGKIEQMGDEA